MIGSRVLNRDKLSKLQLISTNFKMVRKASLKIAKPLSEEDMQIQSMPDASPIKWHLAHTTWAFETFILKSHCNNYSVFNESFEYLFNSYYNAIGEQYPRAHRGLLTRPTYKKILEYRQYVDLNMLEFIENMSAENKSLSYLMLLMINHEQQHQELMLTDIKHALFINPEYPVYKPSTSPEYITSPIKWKEYPADLYEIGHKNEYFYFDNEGPRHRFYLESYAIASRLVTCGEYLEFMKNGGYQHASFWLSEAWSSILSDKITSPFYWIKKQGKWFHYTLSGLLPVELNSPVMHINYFEANAYAASVGKRLPTEQEWEVSSRDASLEGSFRNLDQLHPSTASGDDLQQMFGELWQWTSSSYNAYPGFKVPEGAIGEYNGKFMVNQYVLRGGSIATPKDHIRPSYRNFFYPDASWQYTGIRLAKTL